MTVGAPTAASTMGDVSAKRRSVLLAVGAEPSAAGRRGPRERHLGAVQGSYVSSVLPVRGSARFWASPASP